MVSHIGYPPELLDKTQLENFYEGLDIKPNQHFQNHQKAWFFKKIQPFKELRTPVDKMSWKSDTIWRTPAVTEAIYNRLYNAMFIPGSVLQGRYCSTDRPMFTNYATLGAIIGHEITHGFDTSGRNFNGEGNRVDWWDAGSEAK